MFCLKIVLESLWDTRESDFRTEREESIEDDGIRG